MVNKFGDWKPTGKTIGEGGQGQIIIVENANFPNNSFALKKLKNKNRIQRFKNEIEALLNLNHKNIVSILDFDLDANNPYFVTEFYSKGSLDKLNLDSFTLYDKLNLFKEICEGISFLHNQEYMVIHRDLKPSNIFLTDDLTPVIGDFGLSFIDGSERITITDEAIGSMYYIAPELEDGKMDKLSPSSDIYSLGKILYWLITGDVFSREKYENEEYNITNFIPERAAYLINELFYKMITPIPSNRFQSGDELLLNLNILIKRIKRGNNRIGPNIPQFCIYCGKGKYRKIVHNEPGDEKNYVTLRNSGLGNPVGAPSWVIYACEYCGNIQIFRPDYAENNEWVVDNND